MSDLPVVRVRPTSRPTGGATGRLASIWRPVGGLRVHALASAEPLPPDAPVVVLVHGVAVSSRYLVPLACRLAPRARVYVPDLPGYGRSDTPPHDFSVPELADALLTWLDAAGLDRPHLVGNSFGCQVIAELAARHPERADRVVLQGPTMDPRARSLWRQGLRWLATGTFERYAEGLVLARDVYDLGPRRTLAMLRIGLRHQIERKLPRVRAETLVVRGTRDLIVPQRWAEDVARLLPRGRLVVVEGAAHTINYSQPAWLAELIWAFLHGEEPGQTGASDQAGAPASSATSQSRTSASSASAGSSRTCPAPDSSDRRRSRAPSRS